jgi:hypothetical protein
MCQECEKIKASREDPGHVCNADDVASVKLKQKECKPCPGCGIETFKIDGCRQVWCPPPCGNNEGTAWDFVTGKIDRDRPHAPLYYEYQRKMNGGEAPRVPGDNPCMAAGIPGIPGFLRRSSTKTLSIPRKDLTALLDLHRWIVHIEHVELRRWRRANPTDFETNIDLRIAYLENSIDENLFKETLQRREKEARKANAFFDAIQLIVNVSADIFNEFCEKVRQSTEDNPVTSIQDILNKFEQIRLYYNESITAIRWRFDSKACFLIMTNTQEDSYNWMLK